jgi:hypothetical protein
MNMSARILLSITLIAILAGISCSDKSVQNEPEHPVTLTPWPPDGYTDLGTNITIRWQSNIPHNEDGDTITYDLYFGQGPFLPQVSSDWPVESYYPLLHSQATYSWRVDVRTNHKNPQIGRTWHFSTMNLPPDEPSNPSPANSATDVGVNTIFSWQAADPNSQDTLRYDFYLGTNTNWGPNFIGHNWEVNFHKSQWMIQAEGRALLNQIYSMQNAYRQQHGAYCLNGVIANCQNQTFGRLNIHIDSTNVYTYSMCIEINAFTCTAIANLDADATMDVWTINQDSTLICTINDISEDPSDYSYHPNTIYYWKIVAKDNHGNETSGPIWHFTTGADSL